MVGLALPATHFSLFLTKRARKKEKTKGVKKMAKKKTEKNRNKNLATIAEMPPLYHTLPDAEYHYKKSEVLKWLSERPALMDYLFDRARKNGDVVYNSETGKWQGKDWEVDDED